MWGTAMNSKTIREQLEIYAREKYGVEPELLPFSQEDYAVFRHADTGKWFAVFIVKPRKEFKLDGEGNITVVSLKVHDPLLAETLVQQPGYLRGYPSAKWHWVSIVLDGSVPIGEICKWLDESFLATNSKAKNKFLLKRKLT